jgi:competence protein ComGB
MTKRIEEVMEKENRLSNIFNELGYSSFICSQIEASEIHGNITGTLHLIAQQEQLRKKQKSEFCKVAIYPAILILFAFALLIGLRIFFLPEFAEFHVKNQFALQILFHFPEIFTVTLMFVVVLVVFYKRLSKKFSYISREKFFAGLPFVGKIYQDIFSVYLSSVWGQLMTQGVSLKEMILMMKENIQFGLVKELAFDLEQQLNQGIGVAVRLEELKIVRSDFSFMIRQSEMSDKFGEELLIYSEVISKDLNAKFDRFLQILQPMIFLGIGALILFLYQSLLFPMYENFS